MFRYRVGSQWFDYDSDLQILIGRVMDGFGRIPQIRQHIHKHRIYNRDGVLIAWFTVLSGRVVPILR